MREFALEQQKFKEVTRWSGKRERKIWMRYCNCIDFAKGMAIKENCYKMMLLTGSKNQQTLEFYRKAGYNSTDKTAFVQWMET